MDFIKHLRLDIDKAINSTQLLRQSREVSLTHTNLQRSFMWLGLTLKALGSTSPYVSSENPTTDTIEPQAEHTSESFAEKWATEEYNTHTARVKSFRSILEELITVFKAQQERNSSPVPEYAECLRQSFAALQEAKMWLGWELNRIKKEKEGTATKPTPIDLPL